MVSWTRDNSTRELSEGEFISTGNRFTGVSSNGGTVGIVIENNNSHDLFVPSIVVRAKREGRIEKGFNPTVDTSASNLSFTNTEIH